MMASNEEFALDVDTARSAEINSLIEEFHRIAEEQQTLDLDVPDQNEKHRLNLLRLSVIEMKMSYKLEDVLLAEQQRRRTHLRLIK